MIRRQPSSALFPYTTLFRSVLPPALPRQEGLGRRLARRAVRRVGRGARAAHRRPPPRPLGVAVHQQGDRSEEHTSELQSRQYLVCRLLLEKKSYSIFPSRFS